MDETKSSIGDLRKTTRRGSARRRLIIGSVLLLAAIALVLWIRDATWERIAQLEAEFGAVRSERFLLGLHARESVYRMNAALLRFQLSGEAGERAAFLRIGRELTNRFERTLRELTMEPERRAAHLFADAFGQYREQTADMIEHSARPIRKDTAAQVHELIETKSAPALQAAQALVAAQNGASAEFFSQSTHALVMLRRMLSISVVALLVFTTLLGALAYATFVAPLRAMLVQSQSVLERHEKLAALGTLAAGVAHEIRNPLQAIKMRLFSLKRSLPETWRDDEDLEIISSEINRLEKIVKDTLQFARPGEPELAVLPVADVIGAVAQLLEGSLQKRGIELKTDVAEPVFVQADRRQIQQVLINLVLNAAESIEGSGAVTIRVAADERRETGEWPAVCIEIADTGRGIPPEIERRLFDPFFSTKEGGTGLGLSIAERIVERHGGCIQYSSQLGRGTTFKVILPRHAQHERANSAH